MAAASDLVRPRRAEVLFRGPRPAVDVVEPALVERNPGSSDAKAAVGSYRVVAESVEPSCDGRVPALVEERGPVPGDQLGGLAEVSGCEGMVDRLRDQPVLAVPRGCTAMQESRGTRLSLLELVAEQLAERRW